MARVLPRLDGIRPYRPAAGGARWAFLAFLALAATMLIWLAGSSNPFTPAGYVGYLTRGAVLGKSRFFGVQKGPTSAGRT
jgi:hypothetical protein